MLNLDHLRAFVWAVECGSFSAAARKLGKAQSAVSTAIANLEIDADVELFDRSKRSPVLTAEGEALLPFARSVLLGSQEFMSKAASLSEGEEDRLCLAVEEGIGVQPLLTLLREFEAAFPHVSLELLEPGPNDVAILLQEGRADLGLMTEQEEYPLGFQLCGIGFAQLVPVCAPYHPLAEPDAVTHHHLRAHRQIIPRSRSVQAQRHLGERHSPQVWFAESPFLIRALVEGGLGWAQLPWPVVREALNRGDLARLTYAFQTSDHLAGIDLVWSEKGKLGVAGSWLRDRCLAFPADAWRE